MPFAKRLAFSVTLIAVACSISASPVRADKEPKPPKAPPDMQVVLQKAAKLSKNGKLTKAMPLFNQSLESVSSVQDCIIVADATGSGAPLMAFRRQCMQKALSMCTTREEYMQVALTCRRFQCFDVERAAVENILKMASNAQQLYEIAEAAHKIAATDVVNEALAKAYTLCKSVPDALQFTKEANNYGAESLMRKAVKDLIDDEGSTHELILILDHIEPYGLKDLDRYLLKKTLDVSNKFDDYVEVADAARRFNMADIRNIALYRAKKRKLLQMMKDDKTAAEDAANAKKQETNVDTSKSGF